jgi:hypothetical protein
MTARIAPLLRDGNRTFAVHQWADGTFSPTLYLDGKPTDWFASWKVGKRGAQWAMVWHKTRAAAAQHVEGFGAYVESCLADATVVQADGEDMADILYTEDGRPCRRRVGWAKE